MAFFFRNFLPAFKVLVLLRRRNGRAVECGGLENRCTVRYRGFESLFLRKKNLSSLLGRFFCFKRRKLSVFVREKTKKYQLATKQAWRFNLQGSPIGITFVIPQLFKMKTKKSPLATKQARRLTCSTAYNVSCS